MTDEDVAEMLNARRNTELQADPVACGLTPTSRRRARRRAAIESLRRT
ncbi:hypothetical protein [Mycobacterium sp. URHB0021]|jgi:hypothetical protein